MSCARNYPLAPTSVGGFTMIEVLVTFIILAIGVLGVVSLLVSTKASDYEAMQRARAVSIADNMIERIRTNPRGLATYNIGLGSPIVADPTSPTSEPSPNCLTDACTPQQRAEYDLWLLEQDLLGAAVTVDGNDVTRFPDAVSCITLAPLGAVKQRTGQVQVIIQWEGLLDTGDGVSGSDDVCGSGGSADSQNNRRSVVARTFINDTTEMGLGL